MRRNHLGLVRNAKLGEQIDRRLEVFEIGAAAHDHADQRLTVRRGCWCRHSQYVEVTEMRGKYRGNAVWRCEPRRYAATWQRCQDPLYCSGAALPWSLCSVAFRRRRSVW